MTAIAHYWQRRMPVTQEFSTLSDAIEFLSVGEAYEILSAEKIVEDEDHIVLYGKRLDSLLWAAEAVRERKARTRCPS